MARTSFTEENELVDYIVFHARLQGRRIYARVRVQGIGLPDIDILYADGELVGVEVKYLRGGYAGKFYLGIDEALALLLYGVDRAYLLHGSPEKPEKTLSLVELLPIGYMVYREGREPLILRKAPANPLRGRGEVEEARLRLLEALKNYRG